jgi:uncharacterized protein associated with vWA-MoxR-VMAP ternary system
MSKKKMEQSNISAQGTNAAIVNASGGSKVSVSQHAIQQATKDPQFDQLFRALAEQIKARPEDPNVEKQEIEAQVEQIKAEAAKGEKANANKLERWIGALAEMAPDILDVMAASLGGPVSVFTVVMKKIVDKVKADKAA